MSATAHIKPAHKPIKCYYATLQAYRLQNISHEGAVRSAFQNLLQETAGRHGWFLVPEQPIKVAGKSVTPDGTLKDEFYPRRASNQSATALRSAQ